MFTWIPIYEELGKAILGYRNKRAELLDLLRDLASRDIPTISLRDNDASGEIELSDIDPFTFYADFNRGLTDENRVAILKENKRFFGLASSLPTDFDGIPVANNFQSWWFPYAKDRGRDDIASLWKLAEQAVAGEVGDIDADLFMKCTAIGTVGVGKLTMGMFWLRPRKYLALDSRNRKFLRKKGIEADVKDLPAYLALLDNVNQVLNLDYPSLSRYAYLDSLGKSLPGGAEPTAPTQPEASDRQDYPLNRILYGPPGTGKTYIAIEQAVEVCDGQVPPDRRELVARFNKLREEGRIECVTFHQSYSYEEFIEGIRPVLADDGEATDASPTAGVQFELRDGVFKRLCASARSRAKKRSPGVGHDAANARVWKMSLGNTRDPSEAYIYEDCIEHSYLWLGYGKGLEFTGCDDRDAVKRKLQSVEPDIDGQDYNITSVHAFKNKMQVNDLVVVSDGNSKFRAIGRVSGDYTPPDSDDRGQRRLVEWLVVFDESLPKERVIKGVFAQMSIYQLSEATVKREALVELLAEDEPTTPLNYVMVIDEINRGNISKVFGELITLLETDKRLGQLNEMVATLPYSGQPFGVPSNLYVIGTMNTADRSIALMDTALRRRFEFEEMMPDYPVLADNLGNDGKVDGISIPLLLSAMNGRIEALYDRDHQIGHSYFMEISSLDALKRVFLTRVVPLLQEYFYDDWEKLCSVLNCPYDVETGDGLTDNRHPIVTASRLDSQSDQPLGHGVEEVRLRYALNSGFVAAGGSALAPYFNSIIGTSGHTSTDG